MRLSSAPLRVNRKEERAMVILWTMGKVESKSKSHFREAA
jgi:hypothetical protein